jgi:hypothetical protein
MLGGMFERLGAVVERLTALEGPAFDSERAEAILWFYFGPNAYRPLHDDLGAGAMPRPKPGCSRSASRRSV